MNNENMEFDFKKLWSVITYHWKAIAICFGCFVAVGLVYVFLKTPTYTPSSSLKVQLHEAENSVLSRLQISYFLGQTGRNIQDEVSILKSHKNIQQTIEMLNLQTVVLQKKGLKWMDLYGSESPLIAKYKQSKGTKSNIVVIISPHKSNFQININGNGVAETYTVANIDTTIQGTWGTLSLQTTQPITQKTKLILWDMERLISSYTRQISIMPIQRSNIISISLESHLPERDCDFIQQLIDNYQTISLHEKERLTENVCSFIDKRLHSIAAELDSSENNIEQYRVANKITDLTTETEIYLQVSEDYQKNLIEVESQLNIVDFMSKFVTDDETDDMLLPINWGIEDENGTLATLLEEYNEKMLQKVRLQRTATENNPILIDLTQQIELIRKNIVNCLSCIKESLSIAKNDLNRKNAQLSQRLNKIPTYERHYLDKQRRQEVQEELYLFLYQKREESAVMLSSTVSQAQVIDVPQTDPLTRNPQKTMILGIFGLLGLLLPICVLFLYYAVINTSVLDIDDCQKRLHTTTTGIVQHNKTKALIAPISSQFEEFRRIRENINFMLKEKVQQPFVVLVSSMNEAEGKNYIAIHTALAYAVKNKKTVLVDLDTRANHSYDFEFSQQVDILSANQLTAGNEDLWLPEKLQTIFSDLKQKYDVIVVNSPSLSEVSETFNLRDFVDMTLFVIRFNHSSNRVIDAINRLYDLNRLPNIACVINDVFGNYSDSFYASLK